MLKTPITMVYPAPLEWHFCLWALCLHAQLVFHSGIALNFEKNVVDKLRRTCIVFYLDDNIAFVPFIILTSVIWLFFGQLHCC